MLWITQHVCVITAWMCVFRVSKATHARGDNRRDKGRPPGSPEETRRPSRLCIGDFASLMRLLPSPLIPTVKGSDAVGNRWRQTTTVVIGSSKKSAVKPLKVPPRQSRHDLPQEAFAVTASWHGLQRFAAAGRFCQLLVGSL